MKTIYRKDTLGKANYGWLDTHYHFSFAYYYNPKRMGFGPLRVINDDVIAPQSGFAMHPHRDMEIISYIHRGAITHKDSEGHQGRTCAGDLQVITAGTGIMHSEYNLEDEQTHLFQIWIEPREKGLKPTWAQAQYDKDNKQTLQLLVAGDGSAPLYINQDVKIYLSQLEEGKKISHPLKNDAYMVVLDGELQDNKETLYTGDGVEFHHEDNIALTAKTKSEFLIIELGV